MRLMMAALTASAMLAGLGSPASAEPGITVWLSDSYVKLGYPAQAKPPKGRRLYAAPQIEYQADGLPVGTGTWWQQMDREQRGGRR